MKRKPLQPLAFSLGPCLVGTGKFCNGSGQLLPAATGEMEFIPAKAAILHTGTTVAQQFSA